MMEPLLIIEKMYIIYKNQDFNLVLCKLDTFCSLGNEPKLLILGNM